MALATRCPQCGTTFKVAHDQLKLRAGMVRCGSCKQVFNGVEHLVRNHVDEVIAPPAAPLVVAPAAPAIIARTPVPTAAPAPATEIVHEFSPAAPAPSLAPAPAAISAPISIPAPISTPILSATPPTAEIVSLSPPLPSEARAQLAEKAPEPAIETVAAMPVEIAPPVKDSVSEPVNTPADNEAAPIAKIENHQDAQLEASAIADEAGSAEVDAEKSAAVHTEFYFDPLAASQRQEPHFDADEVGDTAEAAPAAPQPQSSSEAEEPEFVKQGRRAQGLRRVMHIGMVCGSLLLTISAVGQAAYAFRSQLAAQFPPSKPWLEKACAQIGCQVGLPSQIKAVALESDELQVLPRTRNLYALTTLLRNHSHTVQSWPYIELSLNDGNDKAQARRVFSPREYLANPQDEARGFAANGEQPVKIYFEVKEIKASGYRVYLFYP